MAIENLKDRLDIQDTLTRYATALDTHRLELFDDVFTDDAVLDYGETWGPGRYREFREWAQKMLETYVAWQHLLGNMVIEIDGDTAKTMTDCYNPLITETQDKEQRVSHGYARYHDKLIRKTEGWRIVKRHLVSIWRDDLSVVRMKT